MSLLGGPTRVQVQTDGQLDLTNALTNQVNRNVGTGITPYGGQITAGTSGNQQAAFDGVGGLLGPNTRFDNANAALKRSMSGTPVTQIDPAAREAYYQQSVVNPARRDFNDTLRGVDARYGDRWSQDSGAHRAAVNDAAVNFGTNMGGIRGDLVYRDEMAGRESAERAADRALGGAGQAFVADANVRQNLGLASMLGGEERAIEGQGRGEDFNKWMMGQDWANPWLGFAGTALSSTPYAVGQKPGVLGAMGGLLGGIGSMMGG